MNKDNLKAIFAIRNMVTNKVLIAGTTHFGVRKADYRHRLKKGTFANQGLQADWNAYGEKNLEFSILETVNSDNQLVKKERLYLTQYIGNCYNIKLEKETYRHNLVSFTFDRRSLVHRGEKNGMAELNESQTKAFLFMMNSERYTYAQLAPLFKVSIAHLKNIALKNSWKHIEVA